MIRVFIPGAPQGKGRPRMRVVLKGSQAFASAYTPAKTRSYEGVIATAAAEAMAGHPPLACPVQLEIRATMQVPQSWPAWKREAALRGAIAPTTKPDMDNVVKAVLDGFNQVVWQDDVQVVNCTTVKVYGDRPGVSVTVLDTGQQCAQAARRAAA